MRDTASPTIRYPITRGDGTDATRSRGHGSARTWRGHLLLRMEFETEVFTEVLRSLEARLGGDPIGTLVVRELVEWLIREG